MHFFRWLTSRTVRKACELEDAVRKLLNHQRDLLAPHSVAAVEEALAKFRKQIRSGEAPGFIPDQMDALEAIANKWLKPYPHQGLHQNLVMLLEIAVLIIGSRAFLIQPMVIPTGSAQPTLWGVTSQDLRETNTPIPSLPQRIWEKITQGVSYYQIAAPTDLELTGWQETPTQFFPLVKRQQLKTTAGPISVWFPPDEFARQLGLLDESRRAFKKRKFRKGEDIVRARVVTGDHLFVERISYNFRRPRRGEIIVFRSEKHPGMTPDTHYIKRLVGLGGERVRIEDNRHTIINGRELTTNDPGFEKVFSFDPGKPPMPDHYSGHVNGTVWKQTTGTSVLEPLNFPKGTTEITVRPQHYVTFGDNTLNSADSRYWPVPDFPEKQVIGQHWMVFWPFVRNGLNIGWTQQ
ncbi:MAG TPA: signal peptidase I [Verrucomicrobiota bacterium]|nr:signal peptidase I [Verrucomicrobiales bacterium]HRI16341.1 signal peptidase I [Verrucomicrobiota bacterium]